ncbi:Zinc finger CCCH domain-containing protein 32 [Striga hermonthica]|uniref:Zinc finger CCCH domain-containing protein 32 n=1 Tax=Striga hermonthica TaxID=68872 RepID=A0A9N7NMS1_STRHE|nr:Zinc finger CCCH domain-containing protein 32 [Striga hermonthica]
MELYGDQPEAEWGQGTGLEESMRRLNLWSREVYPERPGQPDCAYYMRTGSCGYGVKCRYNHPRDRSISLGGGEYPERVGEPPCQYYLRTGTCKFGPSCKFNHPKNAGGSLASAPLNIYGYPLRPGEKECSYYLKTGQCKFGLTCKFDHPQLDGTSSVSASARPFYPTVQPLSSPSPSPEQYEGGSTGYSVVRPPLVPGSYVAGAYGPMLLPGVVPFPNWGPYSGPVSPAPSPGAQPSGGATSVYGLSQIGSPAPAFTGTYPQLASSDGPSGSLIKEQKFPERPGQPDSQWAYLFVRASRLALFIYKKVTASLDVRANSITRCQLQVTIQHLLMLKCRDNCIARPYMDPDSTGSDYLKVRLMVKRQTGSSVEAQRNKKIRKDRSSIL